MICKFPSFGSSFKHGPTMQQAWWNNCEKRNKKYTQTLEKGRWRYLLFALRWQGQRPLFVRPVGPNPAIVSAGCAGGRWPPGATIEICWICWICWICCCCCGCGCGCGCCCCCWFKKINHIDSGKRGSNTRQCSTKFWQLFSSTLFMWSKYQATQMFKTNRSLVGCGLQDIIPEGQLLVQFPIRRPEMNIFRGQMGINQVGTTERFWWKIPGKGMWPSARLWGGKPTSASAVTGLLRFFWVNVNRIEDIEPSKASNPPIPPFANCFAGCPIATIPWTRSNTSSDQQTKDAENGSHCHWQVLWMQHMRTFRFATCLNKNLRREHA